MKSFKNLICTLCCLSAAAAAAADAYTFPVPERQPGQKSVMGLRVAPIKNVRVAFIGTGVRGGSALKRFAAFPDNATVKAACDLYQSKLDEIQKYLDRKKYPYKVDYYTGPEDWKKVCERDDIDLIYVATPPDLHVPVSVYAMKHGKHVALEVPAARTVADCWKLVDTAEQTQRHCMMLENCNYGDYELAVMNMVEQGMFGEPVHAEAGYLHNMESYRLNMSAKDNWRRLRKPAKNPIVSANGYPTHGLGPIAHWMGINRGDRLTSLYSVSGGDFTLKEAVKEVLGKDTEYAKGHYEPDMNTSIIRTAQNKTILLFYSTSLRRPYSRAYVLNGTKGFTEGYPQRFAFAPDFENDMNAKDIEKLLAKYRHPVYAHFEKAARIFGGHGGMDTVMDLRLLYCLNNGLPLDISVYDGATWSSVAEVSLKSVRLNGAPVEVPDFTRGEWKTAKYKPYQMLKPGKDVIELKAKGLDRSPESYIAPVGDTIVRMSDPRGDGSIGAPVDFVGGTLVIRNGNLDLCYTASAPIDRSKLSYHVKALIAVGSEGGYDNEGTQYLVESGTLYRFAGTKPFQWKWEKITRVPVRIQQQFCEMSVPLQLICPEPDRISVRFRCQADYMPDENRAAPVLTPGNIARAPQTQVTTSPSREKYSSKALNDGQISPEIFWADAAWASQETPDDKFITFQFGKPEQLKRIILYWEKPSQELLVQYPEGSGWKTMATVAPESSELVSKVQLGADLPKTDRIRFLQKNGKGIAGRPNLLWVREIEIY